MKDLSRLDLSHLKKQQLQRSHPFQFLPAHQPNKQYHLHSHLHKYPDGQLNLDTPSTTHAIKPHHFAIKSIAQKPVTPVPKFDQQLIKAQQKYERINSKILTVRQIKQQQVKIRQRASSRASVNSSTNRKLFVSVSRANSRMSEQKGVLVCSSFGTPCQESANKMQQSKASQERQKRQQSSKKIKLTKYMEMRSGEKAARN